MDNLQLVRSYYDALGRYDMKQAASFFNSNGLFKAMDTLEVTRGGAQLQELFSSWVKSFPDMKFQVTNMIASGDQVICEGVVIGTHKGPIKTPQGDIKPTGKSVNVPFCDVIKIGNGKISNLNCYFESTVLIQQLGLSPMKAAA